MVPGDNSKLTRVALTISLHTNAPKQGMGFTETVFRQQIGEYWEARDRAEKARLAAENPPQAQQSRWHRQAEQQQQQGQEQVEPRRSLLRRIGHVLHVLRC